jgi:fusaric acid resistance family protein
LIAQHEILSVFHRKCGFGISERESIALGITSAIWFVTAWPDGPTAVVVAAVLCVLLAPIEEPDKVVVAQYERRSKLSPYVP